MKWYRSVGAASSMLCLITLAMGCAKQDQQPVQTAQSGGETDTRAADEAAIRANDAAWVKAVAAKNADESAAYYANDAVLMPPGSPIVRGKDAIRTGWTQLMALPGFALTFAPEKVTVVGNMAYEIGDYEMTTPDKSGKPQTSKGKYVVVWAKQPDGSWKALVDAPTTTS